MGRGKTRFVLLVSALAVRAAAGAASPWARVADPVFLRIDQKLLPHPAVDAVAQDSEGFLWVGTPAGLARYDGYHFRYFEPGRSNPDAPPGVQALLADPAGRLWIGTPSSGLYCFDEAAETFRAWHADPAGRTGPRSATLNAVASEPGGRLWLGGDSGLDLFDPASGRFERADLGHPGEAQPRVEAILVDRRNTVWAASVRGLYFRRRFEKAFRLFEPASGGDFGSRRFFSLYEDAAGRLWIGSVDRVFVLSPDGRLARTYASSNDPSALPPGEQWGIIEVTPGVFWVASYDGGIAIVDEVAGRIRRIAIDRADPNGLTPGDVWQFLRDRSGLIWIANGPGGLLLHNPANLCVSRLSSRDKHLGAGDIGARTVAFTPDGALWLGGSDRVARLDATTGESTAYSVPNRASVQTLASGADGTLWIGTMEGLCRLAPWARAVDCPSGVPKELGRIFSLLERGETLWVGTGSGLAAVEERAARVRWYRHGDSQSSLSNDFVTVLAADRAGRIWAGTRNGLNRIDPATGRVARFIHDPADSKTLGPGPVTSIVQDRLGRILAGAVAGPLNVLTENGGGTVELRRLGADQGLPERVAALAAGADGRVWASLTNEVASIDPDSLRARLLGPADGVAETEFWGGSAAASTSGTLAFAGTSAVTVLAPGAGAEWRYAPPLVVTALRIGGRAVPGNGRGARALDLPAGSRDITVEFASLDYSEPEALRYSYRLEGYDRGWIDADPAHRLATYTNLSPGTFTLRVRGTNRLGVWSSSSIAVRVRALPAWHETWAFRALTGALLLAAVFGVVRARTEVLRRRAERLEETVAERTKDLENANARLAEMTVTDTLTGLRNRRFLLERIDEDIALALRQGTDLVFFLVDIDHFKRVNDELGHAAGDQVLAQMRGRLEQVFRSSDYVLRWGGEEFLAVTRGSSRGDAPEIAERLRAVVADHPFLLDGGQPLTKTASIGFAAFPFLPSAPRAIAWAQVVELADQALYRAKSGGRNAWVGLAATERTDPELLSRQLAASAEEAASAGALMVLARASQEPASFR